ncbi:MAG: ribosome small subunit-dependent GTPase A [Clostridia bacterium]|nr:ribosome small subunit-dependent GTPase A [Clostridia bacterium]
MSKELEARVTACEGGLYSVYLQNGRFVSCKPRGRFRHERMKILVGDSVTLSEDEKGNRCIDAVSERHGTLMRPPIANVDRLFVTVSAARPEPLTLNIDKLTCIAVHNGIKPVIVITKCELSRENAEFLRQVYTRAGFDCFLTSSAENEGIDALRAYLTNAPSCCLDVFAGASGVGKSTLLNTLFPSLSLKTQEISAKIARGRHTTRSVVLFPVEILTGSGRGYIADTPGFSLLDFESFDFFSKEDLPYTFPEFEPFLGTCRYTKCSHTKEEGCRIIAETSGGAVPPSRHESYKALYGQLKNKHFYD